MKSVRFAILLFLLSSVFGTSCKKDEAREVNTFSVKINGVLRELSGDDKVLTLSTRSNNKLVEVRIIARFSETELITLDVKQQGLSTYDESFITYSPNFNPMMGHSDSYYGPAHASPVDLNGELIQGTFEASLPENWPNEITLTEGKFRIKRPQQ